MGKSFKSLCLLCCGMVLVAAIEGKASSSRKSTPRASPKAAPKTTANAPPSASRSTSLAKSTSAPASAGSTAPSSARVSPASSTAVKPADQTASSGSSTSSASQQPTTPSTRPSTASSASPSPDRNQTALSTNKSSSLCWWSQSRPTAAPCHSHTALPSSSTSKISPSTTRSASTAHSASRTPSSTALPLRPTLGVGTTSPPPTIMKRLHILLFSRDGSTVRVSLDNHTLAALPGFDSAKRHSVFIVPGFTVPATDDKILRAVRAFLAHWEHLNVLVLDWSAFSGQPYFRAVYNLPLVCDAVATWMNQQLEAGLRADAVWLVGQSLGAHLAGRAAASMTSRPARITGLDPAGPLFWTAGPMTRLSRHQAAFVDVIHTDAGWHGLGLHVAVGHLDFWPNYGVGVQPGCSDLRCSHRRALELFIESVTHPAAFPAVLCERDAFRQGSCLITASSVAFMGFAASPASADGNYQLRTAAAGPYGLGNAGLEAKTAKTAERCSQEDPESECREDEHRDEHPLALDPVWRWEDEYTED
ncbi:uncharacterized protein LOC117648477 [Thrips palmi]|uniref:Uncharacterized protein LOC117648477 n=1 Tax=Thrips palmi TaxID=161013 RepID=A0A6P8ZR27_THRPL|nr:uncharacterized protein LOC117648477 [Thrips palmi]